MAERYQSKLQTTLIWKTLWNILKFYSNQVGNSNYNFYIKNSLSIFKNVEQKLFRSFRLRKNDFLNPLDVSEIYEQ